MGFQKGALYWALHKTIIGALPLGFHFLAQEHILWSLVGYRLACYKPQIQRRRKTNILLDRHGLLHICFEFVPDDTSKMGMGSYPNMQHFMSHRNSWRSWVDRITTRIESTSLSDVRVSICM